jgi:hypothetical protein
VYYILYLKRESFENRVGETHFVLHSCPSGYQSFYHPKTDEACCSTEDKDGKTIQCILNDSHHPQLPNCADFIMQSYVEKAKSFCPLSTMPHYYEGKDTKGCTSGKLDKTLSGPETTTQPQCKIYSSLEEDVQSLDSCFQQKQLEQFPCFGKNCVKSVIQTAPRMPVLIQIQFEDSAGVPRVAYTKESMERFLDVSQPNWRNQGLDLSKNVAVAEVAKAYYVEKTIENVQI